MDLNKSKDEFIKYTEKYDLNESKIEIKQEHSIRVMNISREIAQELQLSQEEVDIATLIGLLHDIARFEQFKRYHTFRDAQSIDHGDLGVEILNKDIRKYIETDKYDELIKLAVKNHNKYKIQEGLDAKQKLFAQIIRDADKIDIIYEAIGILWQKRQNEVEESKITPAVFEQVLKNQLIKSEDRKTILDDVIAIVAFIFDINFKVSFEILKNRDYINKMLDRYNFKESKTKEQIEEIRKIANLYIEQKINEQIEG